MAHITTSVFFPVLALLASTSSGLALPPDAGSGRSLVRSSYGTSEATVVSSSSGPTCTPQAGGSTSTDDTPAIASAIAACPSGTIVLPEGVTYHLNSALSFAGCEDCTVQLEGTLKASSDLDYWATQGAMVTLSGVSGASFVSTTGSGVFDGSGQAAWDYFAANSSLSRPTMFLVAGSSNVRVANISFQDAPNVFHSCNAGSSNVAYTDVTLYAVSASENVAKNTDGWDVGPATDVTISGAKVTNDDDCVAFKSGANRVAVTDITCTGSHGLSIGSLGESGNDTVENIYVSGATMINSTKAAGIKLYPGGTEYGTSYVSNVTYANVVVQDCEYAFQVQSCYGSETDYCDEYPSTATLSGIVVNSVSGTISGSDAMNIDCPADGTCGITMSDIDVTAADGDAVYLCANTPSDIGIDCTDGASG